MNSNRKSSHLYPDTAANQAPAARSILAIASKIVASLSNEALERAILANPSPDEREHEGMQLVALSPAAHQVLIQDAELLVERIQAYTTGAWNDHRSRQQGL